MDQRPPKIGLKIIARILDPVLQESIEGDLYEQYLVDLKEFRPRRAKLNYLINVFLFIRYYRLRNSNSKNSSKMGLFINYLKVASRDLKRHKVFTAINLIGLVAGFTVSLLMLQYVLHETSFDGFHTKSDRIYRVINDRYQDGELIQHGTITYPTIGKLMAEDFPEVEAHTRLTTNTISFIELEGSVHRPNGVLIADEHFLEVFDFEVVAGSPAPDNLDEPFEVNLTKSFARRLLGKDEPLESLVDQSLNIDNRSVKVSAILSDPPLNSHLQFDLLISYETFIQMAGEGADNSMEWSDFYHYIVVKEEADHALLHLKMKEFGLRHFKNGEVSGAEETFYLQPLKEAHLNDSLEYEIGSVTDGKVVWAMLFIAILIVLIAWINFMNLTTSRALQRAKEVGVRKSLGAKKTQVVFQIAVESVLLNVMALVLAVVICSLVQPKFNQLVGIELSLDILWKTTVVGLPFGLFFVVLFVLLVGLISMYPGSVVAAFRMQDVIKGTYKLSGELAGFKKALIVFQYSVSLLLIVATIEVGRQINFMVQKDIGMDIDQTMVVTGPALTQWDSTFIEKVSYFKNELSSLSGVEMVTASSRVAGEQTGRSFQIISSADPDQHELTSGFIGVNHDFVELFGLRVLAGRDFGPGDHHFDGSLITNIVINESAVKTLRFESPQEAVGRTITMWGKTWTIIGVVNDFHQLSMHSEIESILLLPEYNTWADVSIRLTSAPTEGLLRAIESKYQEIFPGNYFDYYFLDDQYKAQYLGEYRVKKIVRVFTVLSLLIAILGLYGLILIAISRKTKEIGLRRVLGASHLQVIAAIGKEFFILVMIAVLLSVPLSYFLLTRWQENFAYASGINFFTLLVAGVALIGLALGVMLIQMRKIASSNPSDSLRYE